MVKKILAKHVSEYEVWVFGSRIHGDNLKKFSDLDLAIISANPVDSSSLGALKDAFSESDLPITVDVVDWAATDEGFRTIIKRKYEVIQHKEETP
ncbi:MAG: nucleotidyltransferase domain-containing protein [Mariprofundaceae bacterium]